MSVVMVTGIVVMQYIVVGVGLIQRIPGIPVPQKFIIFLTKITKLRVKSSLFIISIDLIPEKLHQNRVQGVPG